ncbi:hypothetical protein L5515_019000 [Caenorhabditis briggsae]|uniref:Uncharacterized protein n=1 Tax=Caenorhabditis briggsae TaxID=6238 RepID=A0AAE9FIS5_CAEBR|nr:hypothetical protein L5515_019000 [Caenorhabditis briggsae]
MIVGWTQIWNAVRPGYQYGMKFGLDISTGFRDIMVDRLISHTTQTNKKMITMDFSRLLLISTGFLITEIFRLIRRLPKKVCIVQKSTSKYKKTSKSRSQSLQFVFS